MAGAAALVVAAGAVVAADSTCIGGACVGTRGADTITGSSGDDLIAGMEGNDVIDLGLGQDTVYGDEGNDTVIDTSAPTSGFVVARDDVYGDEGNDTINVREPSSGDPRGHADEVHCGPGKKDKVIYNASRDVIAKDCEIKRPG